MEVEYSPGIQLLPDLKSKMRRFSAQLAEVIGKRYAPSVKAEWQLLTDSQGRDRYKLTIRDEEYDAFAEFTPHDLGVPLHMALSLSRLWGDLLQVRSNEQIRKIEAYSDPLLAN